MKLIIKNFKVFSKQIHFYLLINFLFFPIDFDDNNESLNYRNIYILLLFTRWQHSRQLNESAQNIFHLEITNDTFINHISTLICNTTYLTSIIKQDNIIMIIK